MRLNDQLGRTFQHFGECEYPVLVLKVLVELPVKVWIDNVGAIFMTENKSSSSKMQHMDTERLQECRLGAKSNKLYRLLV